jgi:hypothetical protein
MFITTATIAGDGAEVNARAFSRKAEMAILWNERESFR